MAAVWPHRLALKVNNAYVSGWPSCDKQLAASPREKLCTSNPFDVTRVKRVCEVALVCIVDRKLTGVRAYSKLNASIVPTAAQRAPRAPSSYV